MRRSSGTSFPICHPKEMKQVKAGTRPLLQEKETGLKQNLLSAPIRRLLHVAPVSCLLKLSVLV